MYSTLQYVEDRIQNFSRILYRLKIVVVVVVVTCVVVYETLVGRAAL